jgi:hypothetical protein
MMAKRATKKAAPKKSAAKRELIAPRGAKRYIRRDAAGRIKESVSPQKGEEAAKPGQGDRGDRKSASKRTSRKKSSARR